MITGHGGIRTAVRALQTGATTVLEKPVAIRDLLHSVRHALEQDTVRVRRQMERTAHARRIEKLTDREREVMIRLASNQTTKQIAGELGIRAKTVGVHRARIMAKLEADGIAELTTLAHRLGMIE